MKRLYVVEVRRPCVALGLFLLAACNTGPKRKAPEPRPQGPEQVELRETIQQDRPKLEAAWSAEARDLALSVPLARPDEADPQAATTTDWGSESESRLRALLLTSGDARRWATFGLGLRCSQKPERIQGALLTAVSGWMLEAKAPKPALLETAGWAIGTCATPGAESALRAWLAPDATNVPAGLGAAAIVGLGTLADRRGELSEETQAALLDTASGEATAKALYPLSRLSRLSEAVAARLLDVAGELLSQDEHRRTLILALGSAGPLASGPLGQILLSTDYSPMDRSAAAQALTRLGSDGQKILDETLRDILRRGLPTVADSPLWGPLRATLLAVDLPTLSAPELRKLTSLQLPEADKPLVQAQRRRLLWLRCRSADLVARDHSLSAPLLNCDPDKGEVFQLAQINVLARSRIEAQRTRVFEERAGSENPRVAQAALRLIPGHPELADVSNVLAQALADDNPGTRATAAKIIAAYPMRASPSGAQAAGPREGIVQGLKKILEQGDDSPDELLESALAAAGALGALTLKPAVERHCDGERPALYGFAQRALALLGSPKRKCPGKEKKPPMPAPRQEVPVITMKFESDFGPLELRLDDPDSPRTRAFIAELARKGQYTAHGIHRVSSGNALLLGDPDGDGYDDERSPVEEVELSPTPFPALSLGVSTSSEKSTGSQLFVTLADAPQLRGRRVHLGSAAGPWHLLWPGDPLRSAEVTEQGTPAP